MLDRQMAGKIGELHVFNELLNRGVAPYVPLVDEGVDAIVRAPGNWTLNLQITSCGSAGSKYHRWFLMPKFEPRKNFFILGVEFIDRKPGDVWVLPSRVFDAYATGKTQGTSRNLNLDSGIRKHGMPLKDLLCGFRNRWDLIVDYHKYAALMDSVEDLEDVLAMVESLEAPSEEIVTLKDYEYRRGTVPR